MPRERSARGGVGIAGHARLADPRIASTAQDGATATVKATYTLDGQDVDATLTLRDDGGWTRLRRLGTVAATTTLGAAVAIGDVTLPRGGDAVLLLPARYEVAAAPADILAGSATVDVAPGVEVDRRRRGIPRARRDRRRPGARSTPTRRTCATPATQRAAELGD